jgi:homocitrate synthase NifV
MGSEERDAIRAVSEVVEQARLMVWCRMHSQDIRHCSDLGVQMVDLSMPVSDQQIDKKLGRSRDWVLAQIEPHVAEALEMGLEVCVGGEDASRADPEFLWQVAERAEQAGARRFRFADTVGIMEPFQVYDAIRDLSSITDLEIEMHAHDDLGLATANTLAAIRGGATHANTTVHGLGERAGNAPLEEVVMGLRRFYGQADEIDMTRYAGLSELVELASGRSVSWQKSLVGAGVFTHEAGIHVDGLMKDRLNYQGVDPAELGRDHKFVLGKHSGSHAVIQAYADMGMALDREQAESLLQLVRRHAMQTKQPPAIKDLRRFYLEIYSGNQEWTQQ